MILSYLILQLHCYNFNLTKNKLLIISYKIFEFYVPTFFVISYYFSYKVLILKNTSKIKLRIIRIMTPYIIWPTLFFIINNIIYYFLYKKIKYSLKDLFIQLITGKKISGVFWFQCTLSLSYILFSIISLSIKNNFLFIIQLIGIFGNQYHSYHYYHKLFKECIYEVRALIHDLSKVLFYSAIGCSLYSIGNINILKKNRKKSMFFSLISLYFVRDFSILTKKFYYLQNIIYGIGAISNFIFFSNLPLENINNPTFNFFIRYATNHTGGIYYLHKKVKKIIPRNKTLLGCFLNYIVCYFICFFGTKIFGKSNLKFLFI